MPLTISDNPRVGWVKIGDKVIINSSGNYPDQGGGRNGVIVGISEDRLPIQVEWENNTRNSYAIGDLIIIGHSEEEPQDPETFGKTLEFYLRHGQLTNVSFSVKRDGESIFFIGKDGIFALINPKYIFALHDFMDIFEPFAKRIGRRIEFVDTIATPEKLQDCHRTNWYVTRPEVKQKMEKMKPVKLQVSIGGWDSSSLARLINRNLISPF